LVTDFKALRHRVMRNEFHIQLTEGTHAGGAAGGKCLVEGVESTDLLLVEILAAPDLLHVPLDSWLRRILRTTHQVNLSLQDATIATVTPEGLKALG